MRNFGQITTNHLTVLPKKPQTPMSIDAHLQKQHPPCDLQPLFDLHSPLSVCLCSGGFVPACEHTSDQLGLICTTAVESRKGCQYENLALHTGTEKSSL